MKTSFYRAACPFCGHENRAKTRDGGQWSPAIERLCEHFVVNSTCTSGRFYFRNTVTIDAELVGEGDGEEKTA